MDTAIIAGVAGLLGVLVGRLWDSRTEATRWRRDQRDQSYQALLQEFYAFREAIRLLGRVQGADRVTTTEFELVEANYMLWNQCSAAVWLRGSEAVVRHTLLLDDALVQLADRARRQEVSDAQWPAAREPVQQRFDDLVDAVRRDLSLPRLEALRAGSAKRSAVPTPGREG